MAVRAPATGHVYIQANGFAGSDRQSSVYSSNSSWPESQGDVDVGNGDIRPKPRYPHVKDLQAKADATHGFVGIHTPVCVRLLILAVRAGLEGLAVTAF